MIIRKSTSKRYTWSALFLKKTPFTDAIAKTPRKGHTNFKKIRKNTPHLPGLFPKRHPVVLLISEKSPKKHSPSIGGISKTTPCCAATFRKNSKKIFSTPLTVAIPPLFCYTLFQLFFKNFCLSTADYHFFAPKRSHHLSGIFSKKVLLATPVTIAFFCVLFLVAWKSWKIFPNGNKKLIAGSDTTQSSRTGIFILASIVINNAHQRLVQRNEPQHTRWQISLRIKLRPEKQEKVCRFYYKKYSKRLILNLTLSFRLIYYKQSLYLPTTTMAKKWKHHTKNFGNFW